jgi:hypothetical protein
MRLFALLFALVITQPVDAQRAGGNPTRSQSIQPCEPMTTQPGGTTSRNTSTTGSQNPWNNPRGQVLICDSGTGKPPSKPPSKSPATFSLEKHTTRPVWSGFWWPTDPAKAPHLFDSSGPLDKYDRWAGTTTRATEQTRHSSPGVQAGFQGHCDGWSVSSVLYNEPVRAVAANRKGNWLSSSVDVRFETGDVKGLLAALWSGFVWNNQPSGGGSAGGLDPNALNAADFHKFLLFYISENNEPLVVNLSPVAKAVWNYPCDGFKMSGTQVAGTSDWNVTVNLNCADDAVLASYIGRQSYNVTASYTVTAKDPQNWKEPGLTAKWNNPGSHPWWIFCPILNTSGSPKPPTSSSPEYHHPYADDDFRLRVEGLYQVSSGKADSWNSGDFSVTVAK